MKKENNNIINDLISGLLTPLVYLIIIPIASLFFLLLGVETIVFIFLLYSKRVIKFIYDALTIQKQ